ncbi:MAG TPA: T9SS type A sorting domain-containing protein, partial [Candidatus Eisenbacteria bacterium]|nr:T9SS type A sorting domain-containing protein [Candidatus Eisenbacteria bacterium]
SLLIDAQNKCLYVAGDIAVTGTIKSENIGKYLFGKTPPGPPENPEPGIATDLTVHPNPFNPVTTIKYSLDSPTSVTLDIYDVAGRCVKSLVNTRQPAGEYSVSWEGKDNLGNTVTSGVYFARFELGSADHRTVETRKLILLR